MRSSLAAYDEAGFNYDEVRGINWMAAIAENATLQPQDLGAFFGGTFTLPVCFRRVVGPKDNPPPVHNRPLQVYPCMCGADPGPQLKGNETDAFRNASNLVNLKQYKEWCSKDLNRDGSSW